MIRLVRPRTAAAGLAAALLLSGCGGLSDDVVRGVAADFAAGSTAQRCELLAPATLAALVEAESGSCEEALEQLSMGSGEVTQVQVWGRRRRRSSATTPSS